MIISIVNFSHRIQNQILHLGMILTVFYVFAFVSDATSQDTLTSEQPEEVSTLKSRMGLTANQFPDGSIELNSLLRIKVDEIYESVPDAKIEFIHVIPEGEEKILGNATTALNGKVSFMVKAEGLIPDEGGYFTFLTRYEGNDKIRSSESDLRLHPAKLAIEPNEEDSIYTINILATADSSGVPQPIADAIVSVFVKRMYSQLKVGEATTDEEGAAQFEFPGDLPGDENGNLVITAMIEESEDYGNIAATITKAWGSEVTLDVERLPRALWSPHPPAWMVVTFFILMGTVWVHYVIIVYKLFRIRFKKT